MTSEFWLTSLIIVATPGTGALYTLATALSAGWKKAVVAAFGCTLGIVPHMIAASLGLTAILSTYDLLFEALKIAGVAYLVYMAANLWRGGNMNLTQLENVEKSANEIIIQAILINLLNPKLFLFFLAFLPQFVQVNDAAALRQFAIHSIAFMAMTFVVFSIYGCIAGSLRKHALSKPRVVKYLYRGFSAAFLLMSLKLAASSR
jgi:threonine/homoserine/homoserine lactone efflux protein